MQKAIVSGIAAVDCFCHLRPLIHKGGIGHFPYGILKEPRNAQLRFDTVDAAAGRAASTKGAERDMCNLSAVSVVAAEQLSASIDTYPETFGNVHVDKVVFSGVGGIGADRAQIGLVIDITGHAEYFLDNRFDGNAVHGGNGRADNLFRGFIENPGNADAYAEILRVWEIGAQLTKHGVRILDNLPYSVAERYIVPLQKGPHRSS